MPAKAGTQGEPALRLRPWTPASAGATEKEELGTMCLVHTTRMDRVAAGMGVAADHGPAPMLSGTLLATARSSFDAIHPERGGVSTRRR